jgi:hypothetical protein
MAITPSTVSPPFGRSIRQPRRECRTTTAWTPARSFLEIERLRRNGLVGSKGDRELLAKREAVELALAAWCASRADERRRSGTRTPPTATTVG